MKYLRVVLPFGVLSNSSTLCFDARGLKSSRRKVWGKGKEEKNDKEGRGRDNEKNEGDKKRGIVFAIKHWLVPAAKRGFPSS